MFDLWDLVHYAPHALSNLNIYGCHGWIFEHKESLNKFAPIMKMLELLIILQLELIVYPI
jgi:hypothetical protein